MLWTPPGEGFLSLDSLFPCLPPATPMRCGMKGFFGQERENHLIGGLKKNSPRPLFFHQRHCRRRLKWSWSKSRQKRKNGTKTKHFARRKTIFSFCLFFFYCVRLFSKCGKPHLPSPARQTWLFRTFPHCGFSLVVICRQSRQIPHSKKEKHCVCPLGFFLKGKKPPKSIGAN